MALDARRANEEDLQNLFTLIALIRQQSEKQYRQTESIPVVMITTLPPQKTWFERPLLGPLLALLSIALLFAVPVWLAWHISDLLQPIADKFIIHPLSDVLADTPAMVQSMLNGSYGLISLGLYSFIWAFPVVFLIGLSVAVTEDCGLKERIITSLDPLLGKIGLTGNDLVPILSGFGCNVVAVIQSRSCSTCTRKNCISTIAFGSACSYQIGATLSIFSAAGHPAMFAPYLLTVFITACLHTRLWRIAPPLPPILASTQLTWLQFPRWRAVRWALENVIVQFLRQAMPLFLAICIIASFLDYFGVIETLCRIFSPGILYFHLPPEALPGILFSLLRKDGLLILNQDSGNMLHSLNLMQLTMLVWISSTLMACLVTITTIGREVSWRFAASLVIKQALTSLLIAVLISFTMI